MLSPEEQHVFRRCAIFVGSFGLDALAAICSPIHERDVQNSLFALVDKNLVRYVEASAQDTQISEPRFGLLETIREFGVATLLELDELERTQRAYANCYLVLAEALSTDLQTRQASQANTLLTLERANVRAVMRWVLDLQALEIGFRLANALWTFWTQRGGLTEAYPWFEQLLAQAEGEPPSPNYCAALYAAGFAARHSGNLPQAQRYTECCLTMSQTLGDKEHIGLSLAMLCSHAFHQGNYAESRRLGLESLQLRREQGSEWQTAMILLNLGFRETKMGNFEQARLYLEEGLAYQQKIETGDFGMAVAWTWLGQLARWEGDYQGARALQMKSKQLCERSNLPSIYAHTCCELAWLQMLANRYDDAKHAIDEALITCDAQNNKGAMWEVFCPLIGLYAAQGMFEETLTYAAFLTQFLNELGMVLPPVNREQFDRDVAAAKRSLPEEDAATAWAAGEGMPLAHAVASV